MAAARDLLPRAQALGAGMVYQGQPAGWLLKAARAATGAPVVVNVKGIDADSTPVLVTLAELERLHQATPGNAGNAGSAGESVGDGLTDDAAMR